MLLVHQVQGDIRHLENSRRSSHDLQTVQGDIRHLEIKSLTKILKRIVQGDIRHLENTNHHINCG